MNELHSQLRRQKPEYSKTSTFVLEIAVSYLRQQLQNEVDNKQTNTFEVRAEEPKQSVWKINFICFSNCQQRKTLQVITAKRAGTEVRHILFHFKIADWAIELRLKVTEKKEISLDLQEQVQLRLLPIAQKRPRESSIEIFVSKLSLLFMLNLILT